MVQWFFFLIAFPNCAVGFSTLQIMGKASSFANAFCFRHHRDLHLQKNSRRVTTFGELHAILWLLPVCNLFPFFVSFDNLGRFSSQIVSGHVVFCILVGRPFILVVDWSSTFEMMLW